MRISVSGGGSPEVIRSLGGSYYENQLRSFVDALQEASLAPLRGAVERVGLTQRIYQQALSR